MSDQFQIRISPESKTTEGVSVRWTVAATGVSDVASEVAIDNLDLRATAALLLEGAMPPLNPTPETTPPTDGGEAYAKS